MDGSPGLSHSEVRLARRGRNAQHPCLRRSHRSVAVPHRNRSVPQKANHLVEAHCTLPRQPAPTVRNACSTGPSPTPLAAEKSLLRKCNALHLRENTMTAHRASCKRTAFSIAIHMLSTIAAARNIMQNVLCALFCETQPQKHAQIRRIFSVAQMPGSA
jgi:hypothetical protein